VCRGIEHLNVSIRAISSPRHRGLLILAAASRGRYQHIRAPALFNSSKGIRKARGKAHHRLSLGALR
jgi:hypothetical protein